MGETASVLDVRRRYGVPNAVTLRVDAREVLAWIDGYEVSVREVAAHPDDLEVSARWGGRAALRRVVGPCGDLLVREYRKGGLLRKVRGPAMQGRWRPLDELALSRRLLAAGASVANVVGCVVLRLPVGWRGFLVVEEVSGAVDLQGWAYGAADASMHERSAVLHSAGRAVRRVHDEGVPHPDLHPKNLLLGPDGTVRVLDFDKVLPTGGPLDDATRLSNLVRLGRSIEKHRLKGLQLSSRDALRFLEGYAGSRKAARAWFERIRGRLQRGLGLRRLWWRLIGEARPWRPAPGVEGLG